jgi:putative hydrolase of the HAD superfamily
MSEAPRGIVFDAVGTLFYADPPVAEVYASVAGRFGVAIDALHARQRFKIALATIGSTGPLSDAVERLRWVERVRFVFAESLPESDSTLFDELFEALWNRFAQPGAWRLYDDVEEALDLACRRGFRLAVGSNFDSRLHAVVEGLLPGRFDEVAPATALGAAKPDLRFFRGVEAKLGLRPSELTMIGDEVRDDAAGATVAGWSYRLLTADPASRTSRSPGSMIAIVRELPAIRRE